MTRFFRLAAAPLHTLALCVSGLALAPLCAEAATEDLTQLPLEQLMDLRVTSASRFEQTLSEAPSAVVVLTAEDIRRHGWRTLGDALATLPGLYVNYDRNYAYLGARGLQKGGDFGTRFLLLIDGLRSNDAIYGQAAVGTDFLLDLDWVERIEYVPGPGSAVYGSNAYFGTVNVITRSVSSGVAGEVSASTGSFGYHRGAARYGWGDGQGSELMFAASRFNSDGPHQLYFPEFDTPDQNNGVAVDLDDDEATRLFAKGRHGHWSFSAAWVERTKGIPTASYEQLFNDDRAQVRDRRAIGRIGYSAPVARDTDLSAQVYTTLGDALGHYAYEQTNIDIGRSLGYGSNWLLTTRRFKGHELGLGADVEYDLRRQLKNYDESSEPVLDVDRAAHRWGIFAEDQMDLTRRLKLQLGLRLDHDSVSGSNAAPRVALVYTPGQGHTFKALYGRAWRYPNAFELYYALPENFPTQASPDLQAEDIATSEFVWQKSLFEDAILAASYYRYRTRNLITYGQDADGMFQFMNVGRAKADGLELAYTQTLRVDTRLRASVSWQNARDSLTGQRLLNSPHRQADLNASTRLFAAGPIGALEWRYMGDSYGKTGRVSSYSLTNLTLTQPRLFGSRLEAQLSVYNLFDRLYAQPAGPDFTQNAIWQDGRSAVFKLSLGF